MVAALFLDGDAGGPGPRPMRQKAVELRPAAGLRAVRDAELAVDVGEVELDRLLGHPEHAGELRVRVALGDEAEDLQLPAGETGRCLDGERRSADGDGGRAR